MLKKIDYRIDGQSFQACLASPESGQKAPAVIVVHDWTGRNAFADQKAQALSELGYVGFAIDMYGKDITGATVEEKSALIKPMMENRTLLLKRIQAGLEILKQQAEVDSDRIAAIGFCFGGLCVLDLARSGEALAGVVSFHGLLNASGLTEHKIQAKVLVLHGYDDPMVPPDQLLSFADEMKRAEADWQAVLYGNTQHAFTNPQANNADLGTFYNRSADKRSWQAMKNFLEEIFKSS